VRISAVTIAVAAVITAGCGSGAERPKKPEDVVRAWTDAQRTGHIDRATALFALPAVVFNSDQGPVALRTRAEVRSFNASLPCGARLVGTERRGAFVVASFRLTDKPGSRCDGVGAPARTAFKIRGGKILEWLRVPDSGRLPGARPAVPVGPEV
jgi:hypothetical protein